jgi:hypothetical protein
MLQRISALAASTLALVALFVMPVAAESLPAVDTTITIAESGAMHFRLVQMIPEERDGVTDYRFELQKTYLPGNVSIVDNVSGKPLAYDRKETETTIIYDVHFDRPYYEGYSFVIEYDNHKRIVDEGGGLYSFGMRPAVSIKKTERVYTVVFPPKNFTYVGFNKALDHPASVTGEGGGTIVTFRNVTCAPADYAWEVRFRAIGIRDEVRAPDTGGFSVPVPGLTAMAALAAIWAIAALRKR